MYVVEQRVHNVVMSTVHIVHVRVVQVRAVNLIGELSVVRVLYQVE